MLKMEYAVFQEFGNVLLAWQGLYEEEEEEGVEEEVEEEEGEDEEEEGKKKCRWW